ncbi:MAG: hypothetical protein IKN72_01065, partial [Clostridia bacterium]|nr:hypothetical protein [Clostridia bacterium]
MTPERRTVKMKHTHGAAQPQGSDSDAKENAKGKTTHVGGFSFGATCWTRTNDPPVRNIVALLRLERSHCSLFLPARAPPASATGSGGT